MDVMELKMSLKKQVNLYSVRASFEVVKSCCEADSNG